VLPRAITFSTDTPIVERECEPMMARIAGILRAHPEIAVLEVVYVVDDVGAHDHVMRLAEYRAQAVVDALVAHGVAASRLVPIVEDPCPMRTHARCPGHRRVELRVRR